MNTLNTQKTGFINSCHPYLTLGCIISCLLCSIVMIWGVYAMRIDIVRMEELMKIPPSSSHTMMNMSSMDPMDMSMRDMGIMLEGKTGDALDQAFLEGMIPHHQGAVDMARALVNAKHPELRKMGEDIIITQSQEIEQMKRWMKEWGYDRNTLDPKEEMMRDHCKSMPDMVGCEEYR